jgi:DNA replication protein DnaC
MSRPVKQPGETFDAWMDRMTVWNETPEAREWEAAEKEQRARFEASQAYARAKHACIPAEAMGVLRGGTVLRENVYVQAVKNDTSLIMVLAGRIGSGKTLAAALAIIEACKSGEGLFVDVRRLTRWDRFDNEEMDRLLDPSMLVIDDLGGEFTDSKGAFLSLLEEIISHRCGELKRTIITTNFPPEEFKTRYGERIWSRIIGAGVYVGSLDGDMRAE